MLLSLGCSCSVCLLLLLPHFFLHLAALLLQSVSLRLQRDLLFGPTRPLLCQSVLLLLDQICNHISVVLDIDAIFLNLETGTEPGMVCLKLLLVVTQGLHILRKLLLILLREFRGLLELLILAFVLFQDCQELLFFFDALYSLLLVLFDLILDLLSLIANLLIKRVLNARVLAILLI